MPPPQIDASLFSRDRRDFISLLQKHQVQYLVVGGEAVIYYGYARLTGDVDFYFGSGDENARRLYAALMDFWQGNVPAVHSYQELKEDGVIVQFGRPPNRIDLINQIDGVRFDEAWVARHEVRLVSPEGEAPLYYLSLEHLIRNKEASGRPKDLDDLSFLRRVKQ